MPAADVAAGAARIAVARASRVILVARLVERFGYHRVLDGEGFGAAGGNALIHRPTGRAMVHDGVMHAAEAHAVDRVAGVLARVGPHVAHNHVIPTAEAHGVFLDVDTLARGGLSGDGEFAFVAVNREAALQLNQTGYREHHRARSVGRQRLGQGPAQAVRNDGVDRRVIVEQVRDLEHDAAASTAGKPAVTFGARERQVPGAEIPDVALGHHVRGVDLIHAPEVRGQRTQVRNQEIRGRLNRQALGRAVGRVEHGIARCSEIDNV